MSVYSVYERQRQRDRETERQRDREIERQRNRESEKQRIRDYTTYHESGGRIVGDDVS